MMAAADVCELRNVVVQGLVPLSQACQHKRYAPCSWWRLAEKFFSEKRHIAWSGVNSAIKTSWQMRGDLFESITRERTNHSLYCGRSPKFLFPFWKWSYSISIWLKKEGTGLRYHIYLTATTAKKREKFYWSRGSVTSECVTGPEMNTPNKTQRGGIKMKCIRLEPNKCLTLTHSL